MQPPLTCGFPGAASGWMYARIEEGFLGRIPMGRFGRTQEVGRLACFLASDLSGYVTGQVIACDGGLSA